MPKEPPPPPPPRPEPVKLQVKCAAWNCMDFQIDARLEEYTIAHLEEIILARHGDPIENLVLYKDKVGPDSKLEKSSEATVASVSPSTIFYDYYPPLDPFYNRPTAGLVHTTNAVIMLETTEHLAEKPLIEPEKLVWSKVAEHDPWTAKRLAAEAAAAAEAARLKAEEEARIAKELEEKIAAEKAAKKAAKEEAKRLKKEEEARIKAEEEAAEAARIEALAAADPEAAARAAAEKAAREAKEAFEALPARKKGGAVGHFLGGTAVTSLGLDKCNKENLYATVSKEDLLFDIKDKGKISDVYILKEQIDKYDGEDGMILFCLDKGELYGDNGWVVCFTKVDRQHFEMSITAGMGVPPEIK